MYNGKDESATSYRNNNGVEDRRGIDQGQRGLDYGGGPSGQG